jgi:hypothetical protein
MAQIVKSVLFFDYDSVKRSLAGHGSEVAEVFASRSREWLAAIEDGSLLAARPGDQVKRKLLVKRCYADPKSLGEDRDWLTAAGVQIVECAPFAGQGRSAAELHMVLDASDAINHATGFTEFILLSADADLTPILFRLRAHDRSSIIYSNPVTEANYKALADGVLDERALISVLIPGRSTGAKLALAYAKDETPAERPRKAQRETPAPAAEIPAPAQPVSLGAESKEELSALVRRLHQATRVPLFSPRTFAELFRFLAEEVAENGYRFQTTAENVATKLIATGRKVTRRQVGFVVKGLALKGHTFAADDKPQDLAIEFRDQVLYLCKAANITLTDRELALLTAWVAGAASSESAQPAGAAQPRVGVVERVRKSVVSRITGDSGKRSRGSAAAKLAEPESTEDVEDEPETPPQRPARGKRGRAVEPAEETKPVEAEAKTEPEEKPAAGLVAETAAAAEAEAEAQPEIAAASEPEPNAEATPEEQPEPQAAPARRESRAAKLPSSSFVPMPETPRMTPGRKPSLVGAKRASATRAAAKSSAPRKMMADMPDTDEVENSILAAIAEAVDVLVEDRATDTVPPAKADKADNGKGRDAASAETPAPANPAADEDGDDIGDEIQRILASYSQGRNDR